MPSDDAEPDARPMHAFLRVLWRIILTGHAAVAAAWVWMMPGGFPVWHARFWANRGLPVLVIATCVVGVWAGWRRKDALLRLIVLGVPVAWLAVAVTGCVAFPVSARLVSLMPLAASVVLGALAWLAWRRHRLPVAAVAVVSTVAAVFGVTVPLTQRAGAVSTRPVNAPMPQSVPGDRPFWLSRDVMKVADGLDARGGDAYARVLCGGVCLHVYPLLRFWSRSPDRCWGILAPWQQLGDTPLRPWRAVRNGPSVSLLYGDPPFAWVAVSSRDGGAAIEAMRRLDAPVYSHLNAFCKLEIVGLGEPFLSFSPCWESRVEVVVSDYPVGRPARLACLGADGEFRVVQASSAEKGPFLELASGPMARTDPLAITCYDGERPVCRIVLDDWARQASTALSPTAGWGLPQNAIEFSLERHDSFDEVDIYITLAATSVGRGWDSVGHAAGTYRNRMRIEPVAESGPAAADGLQPAERRATGP